MVSTAIHCSDLSPSDRFGPQGPLPRCLQIESIAASECFDAEGVPRLSATDALNLEVAAPLLTQPPPGSTSQVRVERSEEKTTRTVDQGSVVLGSRGGPASAVAAAQARVAQAAETNDEQIGTRLKLAACGGAAADAGGRRCHSGYEWHWKEGKTGGNEGVTLGLGGGSAAAIAGV